MRIIDLFSGAGGLTFGFYYKTKGNAFVRNRKNSFVFANEYDSHAAEAFRKNFSDVLMLNQDIKTLSAAQVQGLIGNDPVDVIIGGPPCQPFSTVGQRIYDEKALLYEEYLRILNIARPKIFLFENVKGLLSMREIFYTRDDEGNIQYEIIKNKETGRERKKPQIAGYGRKLIDIIEKKFGCLDNGLGYKIYKKVLNAVDYGVPESRERVFIVGIRNDLNIQWSFPAASTQARITVKDAISDFPAVNEGERIVKYTSEPNNAYQQLMRRNSRSLTCHYCGIYGEKIRTVIKNVKQGQGKDDFNKLIDQGLIDQRFRLTSGYPNTYGRLIESLPCTTITNNMSTPSGLRCIHYSQDRALTPREGARIQSFPDWFQFDGDKENVTTQIGNAVPPLLAMALSKQISHVLKGS